MYVHQLQTTRKKKVNDLEKDDGTLKKIVRNNNFLKIIKHEIMNLNSRNMPSCFTIDYLLVLENSYHYLSENKSFESVVWLTFIPTYQPIEWILISSSIFRSYSFSYHIIALLIKFFKQCAHFGDPKKELFLDNLDSGGVPISNYMFFIGMIIHTMLTS